MSNYTDEIAILALNENHDASVAVWTETMGLTVLATERVTRVKHDNTGIIRTVDYLLDTLDLPSQNVRLIVRCNDPVAVPTEIITKRSLLLQERFPLARWLTASNHHELHALAARQLDPGSSGAILVVDGMGSRYTEPHPHAQVLDLYECATIFDANPVRKLYSAGTTYRPYQWDQEHIGLGRFYSYVSKHIFGSRYDAGKTMALAGYGDPSVLKSFLSYTDNSSIPYVAGADLRFLRRQPDRTKNYMTSADLAARAQADIEEGMLAFAKFAAELTNGNTLFVSGGVALNCPSNAAIRASGLFKRVLIHPAATDDGISLGGIVMGAQARGIEQKLESFNDPFLGPKIRSQTSRLLAATAGAPCRVTTARDGNLTECIVDILRKGEVVSLYDGRSEFGPRALGHRSIIASPTLSATRDFINRHVKGREDFRPLAPAILQDRVADFFEVDLDFENPHMLLVARAREVTKRRCPAIVHIDGTARVQTVRRVGSPELLSGILKSLESAGLPPILINTSQNGKQQPIVETPEEAFGLFMALPIGALYAPGLIIQKEQPTIGG